MLDIELLPTGEAETLLIVVVDDEYWNVVNHLVSCGLSYPLYEAYNHDDKVQIVVYWRLEASEALEQFGKSKEEIVENLQDAFDFALSEVLEYNIV
jgi:hypothetical protein